MSLIGGRRLPSQLLVGLEGSGGGHLGSGGSAGRLPDPLRPSTSSIRASSLLAGVLPSVHQGSRLNPGASDPSSEGGSRTSPSVSGFLQPSIPRPEGFGVVAPHHRPLDPERLHHLVSLPHGDSTVSPSFHPSGRLDGLPGPAGRLPAGSGSSRFASLSSLRGRRKDVPVQGPLLRSDDNAPSLHEDYGPLFRHLPQVWGQDAPLPGRLANPGLFGDRLSRIEGQAPDNLHRTWHPGQPHKIVSSSHSITSVSRHGDSVSVFYSSTYSSTSQQPPALDRGVSVNPISSSVPFVSSSGPLVVPHCSRLWRDAPNEAAPALPQGPVELPGRSVSGLLVPSLSRGSSLVGSSGTAARGSESLSSSSRRQLLLGRFGCRLGSPSGRTPLLGPLVSSSEVSLYQHERASSSSVRPAGLRTPVGGPVGSAVLRQHHHSRLSSSFRRDVLHSERHGEGDTPLGGESPCPSPASVHHGLVQCHSGRSESPQSGDRVRMDPSSGGSRSPGPQMAGGDRSVCHLPNREAPSVFLTGLRSAGSGDRRSSPILGQSPGLCLSSDSHHKESSCQTEVHEELRVNSHSSVLASEGMVPGPSGTIVRGSHHTVKSKRSTKTAPLPPLPPKSAYASADCMATIKRFARQAGFSSTVAGQLVFCRRQSTRLNYQARWGSYRRWCRDFGHRSSSPSIAKIAEFLTYMFKRKGAALSTIKGYRAMLSAVFKFPLPEISTSPILKDLIRSFEISAPRPLFPPPPWDLDKFLQFLSGPPFEPLARASFLNKTKKALFPLAMATAKRVSELQALSFSVSFQGEDLVLYYDPFFRAKTESAANPLPRSVIVPSLLDFAGDLPERVQCPVRAIKFLRKAARSASYIPSRLFVSPRNPERAMSKNAMSFYLRQIIVDSGAMSSSCPPRAHDIRGIATSLNYYSNLSLSNLMQVATWKSNRVFASRYLKEVSATRDNIRQFGSLVIAGDRLHPRPPQHKH